VADDVIEDRMEGALGIVGSKVIEASEDYLETDDPDLFLGDARLQTLYVRRDLVNRGELIAWAKGQGIEVRKPDELHVTIIYSRTPVDWLKMGQDCLGHDDELKVSAGGPRYMDVLGPPGAEDTLVLSFASSQLSWRHESLKRGGCETSYPEYQAHVSLMQGERGALDEMVKRVVPYRGELVFGPEIFEPTKTD